jgi:hypothetical protein
VASVNKDVGHLDEAQVGELSLEGDEDDDEDARLWLQVHLCPSMASVSLSIDSIQHRPRFPFSRIHMHFGVRAAQLNA